MSWLRLLAPLFANSSVILSIVALLLVWTAWSARELIQATHRVSAAFAAATRILREAADEIEFASKFETLSVQLARTPIVGAGWKRCVPSLIVPEQPGRPVRATSPLQQWFEIVPLLRANGADPRYHTALPGLLVGAGLLFTFLGLSAALSAAGDVVAGGSDQTARSEALRNLLGAASAKFITSVAGLFLSIAYAVLRKRWLRGTEQACQQFLDDLEDRLPFASVAALQAEANQLAERQFAELQRVTTDLFVNLGSTLERGFSSGLEQHLAPLGAAVDQLGRKLDELGARLVGQSGDAIKSVLDKFLDRLNQGSNDSMQQVVADLRAVGVQLQKLGPEINDASIRIGNAAETFASGVGKGLDRALADISGRINELLVEMQRLIDRQRNAGERAVGELVQKIAGAATALENTSAQVGKMLETGAADASQRLVKATEAMSDDLHAVLESFGSVAVEGGRVLADDAKKGGLALRTAAEGVTNDLAQAARSLREAGEQAGLALRAASEGVTNDLAQAGRLLHEAGEQTGVALREGGAGAREALSQAAAPLVQGSQGLAEQIAALGGVSDTLAGRAIALGDTARALAGPLADGANAMAAAGEAARAAGEPLLAAATALGGATNGIGLAAAQLAVVLRQAEELANMLNAAANRFEPLDRTLADALRVLGENLQQYQSAIAEFHGRMDAGLSKSVSGLQAIAKELVDNTNELLDRQS